MIVKYQLQRQNMHCVAETQLLCFGDYFIHFLILTFLHSCISLIQSFIKSNINHWKQIHLVKHSWIV